MGNESISSFQSSGSWYYPSFCIVLDSSYCRQYFSSWGRPSSSVEWMISVSIFQKLLCIRLISWKTNYWYIPYVWFVQSFTAKQCPIKLCVYCYWLDFTVTYKKMLIEKTLLVYLHQSIFWSASQTRKVFRATWDWFCEGVLNFYFGNMNYLSLQTTYCW